MRDETFHIVMTIAITTGFWLSYMLLTSIPNNSGDINAYRQGYAECKSGMESRWDRKAKPDAQ